MIEIRPANSYHHPSPPDLKQVEVKNRSIIAMIEIEKGKKKREKGEKKGERRRRKRCGGGRTQREKENRDGRKGMRKEKLSASFSIFYCILIHIYQKIITV